MTHKQQAFRWKTKYEFAENEIVKMTINILPDQDPNIIRRVFRNECEKYLRDRGIKYPTKASDK